MAAGIRFGRPCQPGKSATGAKPPKIMRVPSNGMSLAASMQGSFMTQAMPALACGSAFVYRTGRDGQPAGACSEPRE
jgi:hypothetical protein